jgi:hypothetical protein
VRVFQTTWDPPAGEQWWIHFKDAARRHCTGDWCIHLDCDEFIPEWEFAEIRAHLAATSDVMVPTRFVNFYANYRVYHASPASVRWVTRKMIIHRNLPEIQFWGDGSNVKLKDKEFTWATSARSFTVQHFGAVRSAARLRESWWAAGRFRRGRSIRLRPPAFVFDLFPHRWDDPDFLPGLAVYDGPLIAAVRNHPRRFVRDGMKMLQCIQGRQRGEAVA